MSKKVENVAEQFDVEAVAGRIEFSSYDCVLKPWTCTGPSPGPGPGPGPLPPGTPTPGAPSIGS